MSLSKKQKSFRVQTVGCKVNQVDSAALVRELRDGGLLEAGKDEHADVCVVNSCTVTIGADRDVRKKISRARRENPESLIVLAGCLSSEGHSAQEDADIVVGNEGKPLLARMIMEKLKEDSKTSAAGAKQKIYGGRAWNVSGRARAFIKVQDGCNWNCAYCIVPTVRGKSRSRAVAEVIEDVRGAAAEGFAEVVLTGIHVGLYGNDMGENGGLADLVHAILNDTDIERLRISSIEPTEVSENLIRLMATRPRLCPHFHIPAQSGDDEILRRMGRPYTRDQFLKITNRIADQVPGVLIGTDLIAGFPGESEEAFQNSLRLVEESPIKHLHVFTYSERPGTRAASMPDQVAPQARRRRCNRLREIGREKLNAFKKTQTGKRHKVLVVKKIGEDCFEGLTRNYLPVLMKGSFEVAREYELVIRGYEEKKDAGILVTGSE
jgi:threonylcarbamoyladenosine tRNA methylthiotransferase MtaB